MSPSPAPDVGFRFDGKNPLAQEAAARLAARYVTRVSEETREAIRALIVRSIREGVTVTETAKLIRSIVGLTSRGAGAVLAYYQRLVAAGTVPARAQALADKYGAKLLRARAKTIARTEVMSALNAGAIEQARQRTAAGLFRNPHKRWLQTPDDYDDVCDRLAALGPIPLEQPFPGGVMAPPRHPNCRCSLAIVEGVRQPSELANTQAPVGPAPGNWNLQGEARIEYARRIQAERAVRRPR